MQRRATACRRLLSVRALGILLAAIAPVTALADCPGSEAGCAGLTFTAAYTGEPIHNVTGGRRTGGTYLDNLDLQLSADRGRVFGIPGLAAFVFVLHNNSAQFSDKYVGDAQVVSNIDAPEAWRFYEAWLDWAPGATESLSARFGLYDLNSEFDSVETGGLFLSSSHGIGPEFSQTGRNGPSIFPVTSLTLRVRATNAAGFYGQAAVLDGVPGDPDDPSSDGIHLSRDDGALVVLEGGFSGGDWRKLAIGTWAYTARFDTLTEITSGGGPRRATGNHGYYAIVDRTFARGDTGALAGFVRFGRAASRFNPFQSYFGAGTALTGFWPARADDQLGLAVAMAFTGAEYREAQQLAGARADHHETSIELTWRAPVTDWLVLQPDVQYIVNPGSDPALDNALTFALRFELTFSRGFDRRRTPEP